LKFSSSSYQSSRACNRVGRPCRPGWQDRLLGCLAGLAGLPGWQGWPGLAGRPGCAVLAGKPGFQVIQSGGGSSRILALQSSMPESRR